MKINHGVNPVPLSPSAHQNFIESILLSLVFGLTVLTPFPVQAYIPSTPVKELTLEERAISIAEEYKISTTTLFNILDSEHYGKDWSDGSQNEAVSPTGDYGLCQIHLASWPDITEKQALSPEWCLRWMAGQIERQNEGIYTSCSCVKQVRAFGVKFPVIKTPADLKPNSALGVGVIVLFKYPTSDHMAQITKLATTGFYIREANAIKCLRGTRFIKYNDLFIRGFYSSSLKDSII